MRIRFISFARPFTRKDERANVDRNDGKAFGELIAAAGELYNKKVSMAMVEMLFSDLSVYTIEQVRAAFAAHRRDPVGGKFWPLTSDFVRHIEGLPVDVANQQWMTVYRAIKAHGSWVTVCFDDPAIHAAIASMGGWIKLCSKSEDDMQFAQKDFVRLYAAAAKSPVLLDSAPRYLLGEISLHNNKLGEEPNGKDIVFIGERRKCLQLLNRPSNQTKKAISVAEIKQIPR